MHRSYRYQEAGAVRSSRKSKSKQPRKPRRTRPSAVIAYVQHSIDTRRLRPGVASDVFQETKRSGHKG